MKKFIFILATLIVASPLSFASAHENHEATTVAETDGYTVMVMKHVCNPNIKNIHDFEALEQGRAPVAALANTVLNCPTTGLPGDAAVAGTVAAPRTNYNFMVKGEKGSVDTLRNQQFVAHKLCESDLGLDVDGNGVVSAATCLDVSHYEFQNVQTETGKIDVREIQAPKGFQFGTVRFTPPVIDGNNDQQSLLAIDSVKGLMKFDASNDTDKMLMLHVYNFVDDKKNGNQGNQSNAAEQRNIIMSEIESLRNQIRDLQTRIARLLEDLASIR